MARGLCRRDCARLPGRSARTAGPRAVRSRHRPCKAGRPVRRNPKSSMRTGCVGRTPLPPLGVGRGRSGRVIGIVRDRSSPTPSPPRPRSWNMSDPGRGPGGEFAVIERQLGLGRIGLGLVRGFGLREGALAASVTTTRTTWSLGMDDASMRTAVERIAQLGGGLVVASRETVHAEVPVRGRDSLRCAVRCHRGQPRNRRSSRRWVQLESPLQDARLPRRSRSSRA